MYSLNDYGWMFADEERRRCFLQSMAREVNKDSVVLDLGSGPGLLALHALSLGARKVFAVDNNPLVKLLYRLAPEEIASGRLHVIHGDSRQTQFPELADVVLADIRGPTSLVNGTLDIVRDALIRLARPGAKVIPFRDRIYLAPVTEEKTHAELDRFWRNIPIAWDLQPLFELERGQMRRTRGKNSRLLAPEKQWATIHWTDSDPIQNVDIISFRVEQEGRFDGILQWFDLDFADDLSLSNSPNCDDRVYGRMCFMLSEPVSVVVDDVINVVFRVYPTRCGEHWVWSGSIERDGKCRARFSENSLKTAQLAAQLVGN
ncbi:MAG: hypothetical protein DYH17_05205 [Xanthomonadales bacterium PRO6]|nr:hypothetical protein [Xanthomonadales bacterium]MCE7930754.1 hypothetical protein [Xanthomonadales bacterium PRO6]